MVRYERQWCSILWFIVFFPWLFSTGVTAMKKREFKEKKIILPIKKRDEKQNRATKPTRDLRSLESGRRKYD